MGYSCTKSAGDMLGVVGHFYATEGNPNVLTIGKRQYFFERGREQADGAVTGTLMVMLPGNLCRKAGGVRIGPDGTLDRFPRVPKVDREEMRNTFFDMSARNPELLSAWAHGKL